METTKVSQEHYLHHGRPLQLLHRALGRVVLHKHLSRFQEQAEQSLACVRAAQVLFQRSFCGLISECGLMIICRCEVQNPGICKKQFHYVIRQLVEEKSVRTTCDTNSDAVFDDSNKTMEEMTG